MSFFRARPKAYAKKITGTINSVTKVVLLVGLFIFGSGFGMALATTGPARAATPEQDLIGANSYIQQALKEAGAGNIEAAKTSYTTYENVWFDIEQPILAKSRDSYKAIEIAMGDVKFAFSKNPVDRQELITALTALDAEHQKFIKGTSNGSSSGSGPFTPSAATSNQTSSSTPTIATLLDSLNRAKILLASGDFAGAAGQIKTFQTDWLDVEGEVKTRSYEDYRQTENDMALAYSQLTQKSATAGAVLDRLVTRLTPYLSAGSYGILDATIILLREGLEGLLVVVALLTFLKKSGNGTRQGFVWAGAGVGLAFSIALAIVIQLLFASAIAGGNREIMEGSIGLVAAVMLIYVSYWMHSKSSAASWNRYIKQRSTAALAQGSLVGLALLSFLAIFREGAESVLFILGMGSNISLTNLLLGLGIGAVILLVLGVLLVVVGLRIPIGPFFTIASVLVFYLCFKFVGTGIHALQVARVLPSTSASYLPENDFFGLFPTWETSGVQLVLLLAAIGVVVYGRIKEKRETALPANPQPPSPAGVNN